MIIKKKMTTEQPSMQLYMNSHSIQITAEKPSTETTTTVPTKKGKLLDLSLIITVITLICLIEAGFLPQKHLGFVCGDLAISYPYTGDTISTNALLLISYLLPILLTLFVEFTRGEKKGLLKVLWHWYREFLIGINVVLVLCQCTKVLAGELRPHFLHTCAPDAAENCTLGEYITDYKCTGDFSRTLIKDSFRSFPSGHSAISVYAATFCALYIHYRFRLLTWGDWLKPMLISTVLLWAPYTAFSRITDHRHHWWDVMAGVIIGLFGSAYAVYVLCGRFKGSVVVTTAAAAARDSRLDNNNENGLRLLPVLNGINRNSNSNNTAAQG